MKKLKIICSLLLCLALFTTSCSGLFKSGDTDETKGGKTPSEQTETNEGGQTEESEEPIDTEETEKEEPTSIDPSNLNSISEFLNLWAQYEKVNQHYIDEYEGFEVLTLIMSGMCFVTSVQYDILNPGYKDGRFEGTLALSGYTNAYLERDNKEMLFGYDHIRDKDGGSPNDKAGDRVVQQGECNLNEVYYFDETSKERNEAVFERSTNEFKLENDDSMSCMIMTGGTLDYDGNESIVSEVLFLRSGTNRYEFVSGVAEGSIGVDFDHISLKENPDLTKEKAIELISKAGYEINFSGGIVDGKITLD